MATPETLYFHTHFMTNLCVSTNMPVGIWWRFSFLIYEQGISVHLFRWSLIFLSIVLHIAMYTLHFFVELIPKYLILFGTIVNEIIFLILFADCC